MYRRKLTKKEQAEINRSRKAFDRAHSNRAGIDMDAIHSHAIAVMVDDDHDRWIYRLKWLDGSIENAKKTVTDFMARIQRSMDEDCELAYEFKWAEDTAKDAATHDVLRTFKQVLIDRGPEAAIKAATNEVMRGARDNSTSTSSTANLVARARLAAWASVVEDYKNAW